MQESINKKENEWGTRKKKEKKEKTIKKKMINRIKKVIALIKKNSVEKKRMERKW